METKSNISQFELVILRIFNNWFALKAAYDFGSRRNNSLQIIVEEIKSICVYFAETNNIDSDLIKTDLESFMNDEFNTVLEDNSANDITNVLIKFWNLLNLQDKSEFESEFQKLPNIQNDWITLNFNKREHEMNMIIDRSSDESDSSDSEVNQLDVDEDGWKVVNYRKRK